jgi:hypothetical protein
VLNQTIKLIIAASLAGSLVACGGGSSSGVGSAATSTNVSQTANVPVVVSDASSDDWATIGVKVLSIALLPQGGGSPVTVYTAPTPAPMINLEELDQLGEILGNISIPVGTYTGATLTVAGNQGDVALTVAADPETGFGAAAAATIDPSNIHIQGTQGSSPSLTVPIRISFDSPLVVSTSQTNALDLEFDLGHPAFIVGHTPPGSADTRWAVNFNGPVHRHRVDDLTRLVLRHSYGSVTAVSTDGSSLTMTKELPTLPVVSPETGVATSQSLQILADATNGTLFYDVDAKTSVTLKSFSSESALVGKFVRVAARYQADGTLVATRVWASSSFNSVWLSPEGHVLHVDAANNVFRVATESGSSVPVVVDSGTQFYFRAPQSALADATPIGSGPAFLTSHNLVRGFKVHVSVVDPLATQLVAQSVDIETAAYDGKISAADTTGFTYTRKFATVIDDYSVTLPYIAAATANGKDANGNAIAGFKWWDFAYPTVVTSGANAVPEFVAASTAGVNFGGTTGMVSAWGASTAIWGDAADPQGWSARQAIMVPTPLPIGAVATGYASGSFTMSVAGGTTPATIDVSTASGSASLVYQVDRTGGVVTVSSIDVTTSAGLASMTTGLSAGVPVKVYGVPQADGSFKADVLLYYTGEMPSAAAID